MAIEQHPIPQDVAGYKFRLIGEMTIKQFAFLASGIIAGLIVYSLPLPFFFKYPLAAIFVMLGAGIAFLPVEGRPMDKWLIAFIKSIYSPTEYVWSKQSEDSAYSRGTKTQQSIIQPTPPVPAPRSEAKISRTSPILSIPEGPEGQPIVPPVIPPKPAPLPIAAPIVPRTPVAPPAPVPPPATTLPVPFTPTTPNTLVGMTLTPDSKILESCLIEIKSKGISLRATKSNRLGQFLFAKPLENGLYQIYTEKPGFTFDVYSLELTGQIVKPLKLQAKMANSK